MNPDETREFLFARQNEYVNDIVKRLTFELGVFALRVRDQLKEYVIPESVKLGREPKTITCLVTSSGELHSLSFAFDIDKADEIIVVATSQTGAAISLLLNTVSKETFFDVGNANIYDVCAWRHLMSVTSVESMSFVI